MAETRRLVVHKTYDASPERVFDAWRRPEIMARWFSAPGWTASVTSEFEVGGSYRIEMRDDGGGQHSQFGEYLEIEPCTRLVFTWTCHELGVVGSVVTVELEARDGATALTLTHELPPDPEICRLHEEGWERCLGQLAVVLRGDID